MNRDIEELSDRDFKLSSSSYFLAIFALGIFLACSSSMVIHAVIPKHPLIVIALSLIAGIVVVPASIFLGLKSISNIDFDKPALSIDRDGIHIHDVRVLRVPTKSVAFVAWSEISRIRYEVSGRYGETKHVVIESSAVGPNGLWIAANSLASINPRDLFEIMRRYRRTITPPPADDPRLKAYDSISWTGLDDEG